MAQVAELGLIMGPEVSTALWRHPRNGSAWYAFGVPDDRWIGVTH